MALKLALVARSIARGLLYCFGLFLLVCGMLSIAAPEIVSSDNPYSVRPGPLLRWFAGVGGILYGLLLMAPPKTLARTPLLLWCLVGSVVVFATGLVVVTMAAPRPSVFDLGVRVLTFFWPVALVIILVETERKQPSAPHQTESAKRREEVPSTLAGREGSAPRM